MAGYKFKEESIMDLRNIVDNKKKIRKPNLNLDSLIYGRVPPQARPIEGAIVGAMLLEPHCIFDIKNLIKSDEFYDPIHQMVCQCIYDLVDENIIPDINLVEQRLRQKGQLELIGGVYGLIKMTNDVVSSANIIPHSRIVKQMSVARRMIAMCADIINQAYDDGCDMSNLLAFAEQEFFKINTDLEEVQMVSRDNIAINVVRAVEERISNSGDDADKNKFLRSGLIEWDRYLGYFRPVIYVIAARPGMGKTDFIIQLICNLARETEVGFISGEMSDEEVCQRIICNTAELDNDFWQKDPLNITEEDKIRFYAGIQNFFNLKVHIESRTTRIDQVTNKIRFWVYKLGVRIVFIDFLQIMTVVDELSKYMTEVQVINYILEKLRALSKELKVPIILLSQLNRELYKRANKEPGLSDLKGSGKIEEIAYQISFLHRPEYYEITIDDMGESTRGLMRQMILKNRGGRTGTANHRYVPKFSKMFEWERPLNLNFNPMGSSFGSSTGPASDVTF